MTEETWYTPAAANMKKVCTDIPKWKYLSGISKEQRLADSAAEAAAKAALEEPHQIKLDLPDLIETPPLEEMTVDNELEEEEEEE